MYLKFLRNNAIKKIFITTGIISFLISIFFIMIIFFTDLSKKVDFSIDMINLKIINPVYVFNENFRLILFNILIGVVTLGVYSISTIFSNIWTLSLIANNIYLNNKNSLLIRILPHGIIEIIVLIMSTVLVYYILISLFLIIKKVIQRESIWKIKLYELVKNIIGLSVLIFILLTVASIVEYFGSIYL